MSFTLFLASTATANSVTSESIIDGSILNVDINASAAIDATKIHDGSVTNTEFGHLDGVVLGTAVADTILAVDSSKNLTLGTGNLTLKNLLLDGFLNLGSPSTLTISSGVVTADSSFHLLDTESAASTDDLDTINGGTIGDIMLLKTVDNARDVTLTENGNIRVIGSSASLTVTQSVVILYFDGTNWFELIHIESYA